MMNIEKYSVLLRSHVDSSTASQWLKAADKTEFCRTLLSDLPEHDLVIEILAKTLGNLLEQHAENFLMSYKKGDGVSILKQGVAKPATVLECQGDVIQVQMDSIVDDQVFIENPQGSVMTFTRSRGNVFICIQGRDISRLKIGKSYQDNSTEALTQRLAMGFA